MDISNRPTAAEPAAQDALASFLSMGFHREGARAVFRFAAPQAEGVFLCGDFNAWSAEALPLTRGEGGVWTVSLPRDAVQDGQCYKYCVCEGGERTLLPDPFAVCAEPFPKTASRVGELGAYSFRDGGWLTYRRACAARIRTGEEPLLIYELDPVSWRLHEGEPPDWERLGDELAVYAKQMGYTHVQLLATAADGAGEPVSTLPIAPDARMGDPTGLLRFVDRMHEAGVGVIFSLCPVAEGDGGRSYVLTARYWIERFHADGLAPAWPRECFAQGREERLLWQTLCHALAEEYPDVLLLSPNGEEALGVPVTSLSERTSARREPSPLSSVSGAYSELFSLMRLRLVEQLTRPGGKRLFMGGEIGMFLSWDPAREVEWFLLEYPMHAGLQLFTAELNHLALSHPSLWSGEGLSPIGERDADLTVLCAARGAQELLILLHRAPTRRCQYTLPLPREGSWEEILNTDGARYGGTDCVNHGVLHTVRSEGGEEALTLTLPAQSALILRRVSEPPVA